MDTVIQIGKKVGAEKKRSNLLEMVRIRISPIAAIVPPPPVFDVVSTHPFFSSALSLAMSRDGSSGGTIRMADISEKGVERHFVPGDKLPVLSAKIV